MEAASSAASEDFASATQSQTTETQNTPQPDKLNSRESKFLEKQRHKTRVFDPKGVYEFRHIKLTLFQSLLQLITMLISVSCMVGMYYLVYLNSKVEITGVGEISDITWVYVFEVLAIIVIIYMAIKDLLKRHQRNPKKGYLLAMTANSFNRMFFNNIIFFLVIFLAFAISVAIQDPTFQTLDVESMGEGAMADFFDAICSLFFIIICFVSFRFCRKELAE